MELQLLNCIYTFQFRPKVKFESESNNTNVSGKLPVPGNSGDSTVFEKFALELWTATTRSDVPLPDGRKYWSTM